MSIESNTVYNPSTRIGEVTGLAYYVHVTVPSTKFEKQWECSLVLDEKAQDEFAARGHSIKEKPEWFPEGSKFVLFKRRVDKKAGGNIIGTNNKPILVNENRKRVDELPKIGNGSKVKIQYSDYDWNWQGKSGVGADLRAIQLLELVEHVEPEGSDFYDEEEF